MVLVSFVLVSVVLVVGYTVFLRSYLTTGIDLFLEFRLEEAASIYLEQMDAASDASLPHSKGLMAYTDYDALPSLITDTFTAEELGKIRFAQCSAGKVHYKLHRFRKPDGSDAYMVLHLLEGTISKEARRRFDRYHLYTPVTAGLVVIGVILALGYWVFFKLLARPVEELHEWVMGLKTDTLESDIREFKYDELNQIAALIRSTSQRLIAGAEREKRFQRYASHELRTPIAVLQNNLELMQMQGVTEDIRFHASWERMNKAVRNMRHLTSSLLWVSRDMDRPVPREEISLDRLIPEIIDENAYLLVGKGINLRTDFRSGVIAGHQVLVRIIVGNLIRNAFQHSYEGEVSIMAGPEGMVIVNDLSGEDSEGTTGYGLGLQLSEQLVDKLGWSIRIDKMSGKFSVRLDFSSPPAAGHAD
ncbi:MAG: HAMP domain-containing histidine kinase [Desulfovibrionaceae bacterium]|nr:HAMP domain-containing histidine kinase [Desulfovibrionaceae bacterium]